MAADLPRNVGFQQWWQPPKINLQLLHPYCWSGSTRYIQVFPDPQRSCFGPLATAPSDPALATAAAGRFKALDLVGFDLASSFGFSFSLGLVGDAFAAFKIFNLLCGVPLLFACFPAAFPEPFFPLLPFLGFLPRVKFLVCFARISVCMLGVSSSSMAASGMVNYRVGLLLHNMCIQLNTHIKSYKNVCAIDICMKTFGLIYLAWGPSGSLDSSGFLSSSIFSMFSRGDASAFGVGTKGASSNGKVSTL